MGRKRVNNSEEFTLGDNPKINNLTYLKIPFFKKVTFKEKISEDNNGKAIFGTGEQIVRYSKSTKEKITKQFQEKSLDVINFEDVTVRIPELCPQCRKLGISKIEKKSNKYDYHSRSGSSLFKDSQKPRKETKRQDEYWLTYDHKTNGKLKKCRIAKFNKTNMTFVNSKNKINELHKHFFPYFLEQLKKIQSV